MLVFAFDRDWTVDVNPHPRHEAVPLDWVRQLAHETDHAVYAIGNQTLADEAAIPGVVDIVGMHPDDWDTWLGGKQPDGHYERFPTRRERLRLVADLHPDAEGYVVVDDLDLGDLEGWDHYHAWEFVPAVRRGDLDPDLPWVEEPVADGGLATKAGIVPSDASHLADFLEDYGDASAFEITYEDDGSDTGPRILDRVELLTRTVERPGVAPVLQCYPIEPDEASFGVRVQDITLLSVVASPRTSLVDDADTPAERAAALRQLASDDPARVDVSRVISLLDRDDDAPRRDALHALWAIADVRPGDCTPALPVLRSLLERDECTDTAVVLETVATLAAADARDVAPLATELVPYLASDDAPARRAAARCFSELASDDPVDAVDAVPALATLLDDDAEGRQYAAYALCRVADDAPEAVEPVVPALQDLAVDESASDTERVSATAALGRVTGANPDAALPVVDDLAALLDTESHRLRNNAIGLLGDIAKRHQDWVVPHADDLARFLDADDEFTRVNATAALARLAETHPEAVDRLTDRFVDLLDDDHPLVRENACWALGHLEAETARAALEGSAVDDDEDVRTRAQWALARIEGSSTLDSRSPEE